MGSIGFRVSRLTAAEALRVVGRSTQARVKLIDTTVDDINPALP